MVLLITIRTKNLHAQLERFQLKWHSYCDLQNNPYTIQKCQVSSQQSLVGMTRSADQATGDEKKCMFDYCKAQSTAQSADVYNFVSSYSLLQKVHHHPKRRPLRLCSYRRIGLFYTLTHTKSWRAFYTSSSSFGISSINVKTHLFQNGVTV
jgi:hypothetical protein